MYTSEVVRLNIMSWVGTSVLGASHYYAKVSFYMPDNTASWEEHELEEVLDEDGAQRLNDNEFPTPAYLDDVPRYSAGDTSHRFLSYEKLIQEALEQWRTIVPHGKVLIACGIPSCGPAEILAGPKKLKRLGNQVWKKWEISEHNDALCIQLDGQWDALFKKAGFLDLTSR